jgi:hypothetical protein
MSGESAVVVHRRGRAEIVRVAGCTERVGWGAVRSAVVMAWH